MTHATAPTQFVEAKGIRFAYRRFGKQDGVPLLFMQHFRGGMDNWDPTVTDGFAWGRPVILFNNAGVASSSGETPNTIDAMGEYAADFVNALRLSQVDVLGFSIGGYVAQALTLRHPKLVRRLMLVGTGPRAGEPTQDTKVMQHATTPETSLEDYLYLFFSPSASSQDAGRAFWVRRHLRKNDVDPPSSPQTMAAQIAAFTEWRQVRGERFAELKSITQPTLVANGNRDIMIPATHRNFSTPTCSYYMHALFWTGDQNREQTSQQTKKCCGNNMTNTLLTDVTNADIALNWDAFVQPGIPVVANDLPPSDTQRRLSPTSSTLIYGNRDAVPFDTFITVKDARTLVEWVKASGKNLTTIYATPDPGDHSFGARAILERFPDYTQCGRPELSAEAGHGHNAAWTEAKI